MSISAHLANLTLETGNHQIPDSSYAAAEKMLLDTMACAFAGIRAPGIAELISLERELAGPGRATVLLTGDRLALPSAAYCNSAIIHAMDFDNNYPGADLHIMSIVTPIAMACGEAFDIDGRSLLASIIIGVEVAARIAKPFMKAKTQHRYFLTTSLVGGWGGVATAARLFRLSTAQTINAFGIYYAHTAGNRQALLERSLTKRLQPAIATRAALYSVLLASRGFTGPEHSFAGKAGFYRLYTQSEPPASSQFKSKPASFGIEELTVKQFPTCGIHHGCIAAALEMKRKYGFAGHEITRVEYYLREGGNTLVSMPFRLGATPQIDAQFCAPYAIALALNRGEVHIRDFFDDAILGDQSTIDLAGRTEEVTVFSQMKLADCTEPEERYRYLKVYLRDGRELEHATSTLPFSDPQAMGLEQVEAKFRECVSLHPELDHTVTDHLIAIIKNFRHLAKAGEFTGKSMPLLR